MLIKPVIYISPSHWLRVGCLVGMVYVVALLFTATAQAQAWPLGPGDLVRITVYDHPDLTLETRVAEDASIVFPLVGQIPVGGLTVTQLAQRIAAGLHKGGFVKDPQINAIILQYRSFQVSVLGQVNRPGKYQLEQRPVRLTDVLALAGGPANTGADQIVITRTRDGTPEKHVVDLAHMMDDGVQSLDLMLEDGDVVYVPRMPVFYVFGEVQRPGAYRLERGMTVMQALSLGGGFTQRGSERGVVIKRRDSQGQVTAGKAELGDVLTANDVVYVEERFF